MSEHRSAVALRSVVARAMRGRRSLAVFSLGALAASLIGSWHVVAAQPQKSAWDGVYSDAQAKRGYALYNANCLACHGQQLNGGDRAPALVGPAFQGKWSNGPIASLLDYMQVQMPLQSPGGLTRHQNADVLAFLLQRNGSAVGQKDLWIDGPEGGFPAPRRSAQYGQVATASTSRGEAFYTEAQARRGKLAFNRNCAFCHTVDPKLSTPEDLVAPLPSTFGGHFIERVVDGKVVYPNALMLYSKLLSMPAFNVRAITEQQRVDITAYILQSNGMPSGKEELPLDPNLMRSMMLNEPGFEHIFNGKDFSGWNFDLAPNCKRAPEGCGRTEPGDVLRVENGAIVCECYIHGTMYTDKKYKDFTLRFDMKFEKPWELGDGDDEELFSGGTGYFIFSDYDKLLGGTTPKSIEVEGRYRDILDFFAIGGAGKVGHVDLEAKRRVLRPLGQWNTIEMVAKKQNLKTFFNGVLVSEIPHHEYDYAGHIAFQSQGRKLAWRNIRIKAE